MQSEGIDFVPNSRSSIEIAQFLVAPTRDLCAPNAFWMNSDGSRRKDRAHAPGPEKRGQTTPIISANC